MLLQDMLLQDMLFSPCDASTTCFYAGSSRRGCCVPAATLAEAGETTSGTPTHRNARGDGCDWTPAAAAVENETDDEMRNEVGRGVGTEVGNKVGSNVAQASEATTGRVAGTRPQHCGGPATAGRRRIR
jgi:hypothetical protein